MNHTEGRRSRKGPVSEASPAAGTLGALGAAEALLVYPEYVLRLFISGFTARSQRAIDNLKTICERHLAGRYRIEVVDLHQSPALAREEQIIATPTLLRIRPLPSQRVIGDLSHVDKVLTGLDIR